MSIFQLEIILFSDPFAEGVHYVYAENQSHPTIFRNSIC